MMRIDDTSVPRVPIAAPIAFATYPLVIFAGTYAPIVAALVTFASFVACARSVPRSVLYGVIVTTVVTVLAAARQPEHFFWGLFGNALEPTTAVGISAIACAFAMGIVLQSMVPEMLRSFNLVAAAIATWVLSLHAFNGLAPGQPGYDLGVATLFFAAAVVGVCAFRRDSLPFPRFVGIASAMVSATAACLMFVTLHDFTAEEQAGYKDSYAIATSLWASDWEASLFGSGPRTFPDAWHIHRPAAVLTSSQWDAEPDSSRSALLTFGVEYGIPALWTIGALLIAGIMRAAVNREWAQASIWASVLVVVALSSPPLVGCIALAALLGAASSRVSCHAGRWLVIAGRSLIILAAACCIWFGVAIVYARVQAQQEDLMTLSPADFVNRMNAFPGMPAPFAEVTERRIALWRVYISMRIQRGEPIVLGDRRDLLGYLFDELGAQSRSRAGFKPSLFSAQLALWAAGQGYAFHLGTARSRLDVLLERAPLHVVARALRARVAERLGISGLSQRDEETAVRLRPGLDTED